MIYSRTNHKLYEQIKYVCCHFSLKRHIKQKTNPYNVQAETTLIQPYETIQTTTQQHRLCSALLTISTFQYTNTNNSQHYFRIYYQIFIAGESGVNNCLTANQTSTRCQKNEHSTFHVNSL